jgi:hypothetical protein
MANISRESFKLLLEESLNGLSLLRTMFEGCNNLNHSLDIKYPYSSTPLCFRSPGFPEPNLIRYTPYSNCNGKDGPAMDVDQKVDNVLNRINSFLLRRRVYFGFTDVSWYDLLKRHKEEIPEGFSLEIKFLLETIGKLTFLKRDFISSSLTRQKSISEIIDRLSVETSFKMRGHIDF